MNEVVNKVPQLRFPEFSGEWKHKPLSHFLFEHKERNYDAEFSKDKVLSVSGDCGVVNQIKHLGRSYAGQSILNYHIVRSKDVVYTKSPLKANPYGIIKTNKGEAGVVSTLYAVYRCKDNINAYFLDYYFSLDDHLNKYLRPLVQKGAKNDMKINNQRVLIDPISIPTKLEQQKIAAFLSAVDTKIEQLSKKQKLLGEYKKGLMQKIFSQEIRFRADDGGEFPDWEEKKLGSILNEYNEKNSKLYPQYTIGKKGVVLLEDSRHDIKEHKTFKLNDFVVGIGIDEMNVNTNIENGCCSPIYNVFHIKEAELLAAFAFYYLPKSLNRNKRMFTKKSTRREYEISKTDLLKEKLILPSLEEQTKIASFLSSIDSKIEQVQKQLEISKEFKKALLQQMFV